MQQSTRGGPDRARVPSGQARPGFNTSVHGARGLFASAVFVFHVVNSGLATWPPLAAAAPDFLLRLGEYGVELFFCVSGFVIAGTLRRAPGPASFLEDRAIRIYPVLTATVLVIAVLGLVTDFKGYGTITAGQLAWLLPLNCLALPGVLPVPELHPAAWSLSYEVTFYLFCALGWALRRRGLRWAVALLLAAAGVMLAMYPRGLPFVAGVLVAEGYVNRPATAALVRHPGPLLLVFLVLWGWMDALSGPATLINSTVFEWAGDRRLLLALVALPAVTLGFAGVAGGYGLLGRLLRSRPLQYLGTISYSFYLWHPIAMAGVKAAMVRSGLAAWSGENAQLVFFALSLPPALVVSDLSQRLLERRAGLWLRRRLHHPAPLAVVAGASAPRSGAA